LASGVNAAYITAGLLTGGSKKRRSACAEMLKKQRIIHSQRRFGKVMSAS
jgi:hypothetical protein